MRPVKVRLQNFITYVDQTFDFNFNCGVLLGATGSGKSTVLDGITWALWGRARSAPKNLARYGELPIQVDFLFETDNQTYAVERKWTTGGSLRFSRRKGDEWEAISGRTLAETQEAINSVVRVSYDTFLCSSFLQQGKADAFMVRGPADRKRILEDILDLGSYEMWSGRARSRSASSENEAKAIAASIEALEGQCIDPSELEALPKLVSERDVLQKRIEIGEPKIEKLREEVSTLRMQKVSPTELRYKTDELSRRLQEISNRGTEVQRLSICPTCTQPVVQSVKESLFANLKSQYSQLAEEFNTVCGQIEERNSLNETIESSIRDCQQKIDTYAPALSNMRSTVLSLEAKISRLQALKDFNQQIAKDVEERTKKLEAVRTKSSDYKAVSEMFGRNGIPASIVKKVVPELQVSANEFLQLLTDGQFQIAIRTGTDSGRETLEVDVIDGVYTRPYETYSGGQSFRINLSIRLALSLLLARVSGTQLRFLVVDEGFGSNDAEGRQLIVECIKRVQSHFDCVLVITHMDDIKDAFSTRFEANRTLEGSEIRQV